MHAAFRIWQFTPTYWHFSGFPAAPIKIFSEILDGYAILQIRSLRRVSAEPRQSRPDPGSIDEEQFTHSPAFCALWSQDSQ